MNKSIDWIIHLVANGVTCEECGEVENSFIPGCCNAHTHGMEKYGHQDFQLVLALPPQEIGRILNTFGRAVQNGSKFYNGQFVNGIYEDCAVQLLEFDEGDRRVLRVIIPDRHNVFPYESECEFPYAMQLMKTED